MADIEENKPSLDSPQEEALQESSNNNNTGTGESKTSPASILEEGTLLDSSKKANNAATATTTTTTTPSYRRKDDEEDQDETEFDEDDNEEAPLMDVLEEFAQGTSIHGVSYLFDFQHYTFRKRQLWCPIILICTGLMITQVSHLINEYREYDVNVNMHQTFPAELEFPQVTVCNLNMYDARRQNTTGISSPRNQTELELISTPLEDFIYSTSFNTQQNISVDSAWKPVITPYGRCFEFTTNLTIVEPGFSGDMDANSGLSFLLNIRQERYHHDNSVTAGARIFIAQRGQHVTEHQRNVMVSPGTDASIGLTLTEYHREPLDPWTKCRSHVDGFQYHQSVCRSLCLELAIQQYCHCQQIGGSIPDMPYCTEADHQNCTVFQHSPREMLEHCDCSRPPCEQDDYETTMSSVPFSYRYLQSFATQYRERFRAEYPLLVNTTSEEADSWITQIARTNLITVNINYEVMELNVVTETIAMTFPSLVGQLGGLTGLYLGISIISCIELFGELFALRLIPRMFGHRRLYGIGSR